MDFKDANGAAMQGWRRPAATGTAMCVRMETYFPKLSPEQTWKMVNNFEERNSWDVRIESP